VNLLKQLGSNSVDFIDRVSVRLPTQEFEVLELPDDIPGSPDVPHLLHR
jgi:hypothetical protein